MYSRRSYIEAMHSRDTSFGTNTHTHQDADFSSCPSLLKLPCGAQFCIIKCSGEMNTESQCKTHVQYSCSFCQNTFTRNP